MLGFDILSAMETESVRSGRSDRSSHSQVARQHHRVHGGRRSAHRSSRSSDAESQRLRRGTDRDTDPDTDRDDRSVSTRASRRMRHGLASEFIPEGGVAAVDYSRGRPPVVHDDDWGENTTVITGATSEIGFSLEDVRIGKDLDEQIGFRCARYVGFVLAAIISFLAFISPVAMIVLPKINILDWPMDSCKPDCEGLLLGLGFKLLILLLGSWALFIRRPKATLPRIDILRAIVLFLVFILTFAYWLFYGVRIYLKDDVQYVNIVAFSGSLADALLFVHYLSVVLLELRQLQPQYIVKVTRSPDGESMSYTVGQMTIQNLAVWCLEQYYKDFQVYNPYLECLPRKSQRVTGFKIYEVDGVSGSAPVAPSHGMLSPPGSGHRDTGHNDRFYEEQEYERRVRRRRARLVVAAEEAFNHVRRFDRESGLIRHRLFHDMLISCFFMSATEHDKCDINNSTLWL